MSRVKREGEGRVSRVKKCAYSQVKRELVSRDGEGRVSRSKGSTYSRVKKN